MTDPAAYRPGDFLEERITLEDDRVISVRLSPVHMGDQFLGTVSIFRDITREVEVDRLKSEFVATVSHETAHAHDVDQGLRGPAVVGRRGWH